MNPLPTIQATLLSFGPGHAKLDPKTGGPLQFVNPVYPDREYLLTRALQTHTPDHAWGSGHLITGTGADRWQTPHSVNFTEDGVEAEFRTTVGISIKVTRSGGAVLTERYQFRNDTLMDIEVLAAGIQTPFGDLYDDSPTALAQAVNAHVFTAGKWAWVMAQPMSGEGSILGLHVTEGGLYSYGIESRNSTTSSNFRGHIVLNVTDAARAPHSFGGQPTISLAPGQSYAVAWELGWYGTVAEFMVQNEAPAEFERLAAPVDGTLFIRTIFPVSCDSSEVSISAAPDASGYHVSSTSPGSYYLKIAGAGQTEVLFYAPVQDVIGKRIRYILDHQRPTERPGVLEHAFVPVDTRNKQRTNANGWHDWSDGSERIGMALMMQRAQRRGLTTGNMDEALAGWAQFARENLLDETFAPRRGTYMQDGEIRLYDMPWLTLFFIDRYRTDGDVADLNLAAAILNRGFEMNIGQFLAIGLPEACVKTAAGLEARGRHAEAVALRGQLLESARHFEMMGHNLPKHEVSYEQSMVAPLLELMIFAHRLTGDALYYHAIEERLPWLLSFSGPQPHARLYGVPIRHWDGYWFGLNRQWGDVFPHHWSSLTAAVLARLPQTLRTPETDALATAILRSNMASHFRDGSATCAFVFPATVDGESAHDADPLANDQDWPLAIWLELAESEHLPLS